MLLPLRGLGDQVSLTPAKGLIESLLVHICPFCLVCLFSVYNPLFICPLHRFALSYWHPLLRLFPFSFPTPSFFFLFSYCLRAQIRNSPFLPTVIIFTPDGPHIRQ